MLNEFCSWSLSSYLSQPFFSMHRLLYCSGKSCTLFNISFERWFVVELFICPEERGRAGWVTVVLSDSFCLLVFLSWLLKYVLIVLHYYVFFFMFFFLISFRLQHFTVKSDSKEYLLFENMESNMCNKLSAL